MQGVRSRETRILWGKSRSSLSYAIPYFRRFTLPKDGLRCN
jgi:hypothetical protein